MKPLNNGGMRVNVKDVKHEIQYLNLSEKIILVKDIWDSIAYSNDPLPIPEWQKKILDQRSQSYPLENVELEGWQDVHKAIQAKHS